MGYGGSPRLSGRALLGGFGLLALVLTIGILAMLAIRVLDSSPSTAADPSNGVLEQLGGAPPQASSGTPSAPTAGSEAARRSACAADRSTLELASAAYQTLRGTAPPDQAALVAEGLLDAEVATYRLASSGGAAEIVGAGDCADV